jgi:hypothetical protein
MNASNRNDRNGPPLNVRHDRDQRQHVPVVVPLGELVQRPSG